MTTATLLVELLTEELPPKALRQLGEAFSEGVAAGLKERGFLTDESRTTPYATPRRLAVTISAVRKQSLDHEFERKLMPVKVGLDVVGKPTPALTKKLASIGLAEVAVEQMERRLDGKTETLFYRQLAAGAPLRASLEGALQDAIEKLPIPKVMSYQDAEGNSIQFVRPAHKLVALLGNEVEPVTALGLIAYRTTLGHRFLSAGDIPIGDADSYAETLRTKGRVIASFDERRVMIEAGLTKAAEGESIIQSDALLDEVTALVEWPAIYRGEFEAAFLSVPPECLILSMQQHQKYFPLADADGKLQNRFLIVSNLPTDEPGEIVRGNQRVLRARLSDAKFFFDQDKKVTLHARIPKLANVVYHNQLGSQLLRILRLTKLTGEIAEKLGVDTQLAKRAAFLCKADLLTDMVGEFPELQGVMGRYYALHDGEARVVADAIEAHYRPRFAGDTLPKGDIPVVLALADKLDTLVSIFSIGQAPSGDKDPFGLRRQAIGVLRILSELSLPLTLDELLIAGFSCLTDESVYQEWASYIKPQPSSGSEMQLFAVGYSIPNLAPDLFDRVREFMLERLRNYLRDQGYEADAIDAVVSQDSNMRIDLVVPRLEAVRRFRAMPEANALSSANKRTRNILKKASSAERSCDPRLFTQPAERNLYSAVAKLEPAVGASVHEQDYTGALKQLAGIRSEVDAFFDDVMVMTDDPAIRANRLALLTQLNSLMNQVADISKLAA